MELRNAIEMILHLFLSHFKSELTELSSTPLPEVLEFSPSCYHINSDIYPFLDTDFDYPDMDTAYLAINNFLENVANFLAIDSQDLELLPTIFAILTYLFILQSFPRNKKLWNSYMTCWRSGENHIHNQPLQLDYIPQDNRLLYLITFIQSCISSCT